MTLNINRRWKKSHFGSGFKQQFTTMKQLIQKRKWTEELISKFLGKPDYTGSAISKGKCYEIDYYKLSRVREIESMNVFREAVRC